MTYRPQETVFGAPLLARLPSVLYLVAASAVALIVVAGEASSPGSWVFHYVVEEDVRRVMHIRTFAIILGLSALASVVRANMRGVRIFADGVEARDVMGGLLPKLRRYRWPQIECIVFGTSTVSFDLWDGSRAYLPDVSDRDELQYALEHVAAARAIPVRGGKHAIEEGDEADEE